MLRGRLLAALLLTVTLAVATQPGPVTAAPGDYVQAQFGQSPSILYTGSTYYRYVDGFDYGDPFIIPVFSSPDLVTWTWIGNAMTPASLGAWTDTSGFSFSSPSVLEIPSNPAASRFVLYFTGKQAGTGRKCVGYAVASSPAGPFEGADVPLVCPAGAAAETAVEPSAMPYVAGAPYQQIVFRKTGSDPGIYVQVLSADGQSVHSGAPAPKRVFSADTTVWPQGPDHWAGGVVERPGIAWGPNYTPYLLFSGTDPVTSTRVAGAVKCTQGFGLLGECVKVPVDGGRWFGSTGDVVSPGRVQAFTAGAHQWITYQAAAAGSCHGQACLAQGASYVDKLCFANGLPRTNAPTTGASTTRFSLCTQDIPAAWQTTWMSASDGVPFWNVHQTFPNETLRQMAHTTTGGNAVRVRLSNLHNTAPLQIGAATVAVSAQQQGATAAVLGPIKTVTFGGEQSVTIPAGKEVVSDPVALAVPGDHDLAISLYIPQWAAGDNLAGQAFGPETSFVGSGNLVNQAGTGAEFPATTCDGITCNANFVTSVQVLADASLGSIVVIGDSLTDGLFNAHGRDDASMWTEVLHTRLRGQGLAQASVGDTAIAGETLLPADDPLDIQGRFDRDVLGHAGVRTVIIEIGANDIDRNRSAPEILQGLQSLVDRAHAAGLRAIGVTIPPYAWRSANVRFPAYEGGPWRPCFQDNPAPSEADVLQDEQRTMVNQALLGGQVNFDAILDFDLILRDQDNPMRPKDSYLTWDCVHLTPSGHVDLANSIVLSSLLTP